MDGFSSNFGDPHIVALHDAEGDLHIVFADTYREVCTVFPVVHQHLLEREAGEDVSINDKEGTLRPLHQLETTRGTHRMIFLQIIQAHAEVFTCPEVFQNRFGKVVRGEIYIANAGPVELLNDQFQ